MTTQQRVFVDGRVPHPENRDKRRDLMFEAVATMDAAAIHTLICRDHANLNDVQLACERAELDFGELVDTYTTWLNETAARVRAADAKRVYTRIGQPSLLAATAHSPMEEAS